MVNVDSPGVLSLPSLKKLDLINIKTDIKRLQHPVTSVNDLKAAYPNQFDRIVNFREPARLHVKENTTSYCDAPRKTSIHLMPKIKQELEKMEKEGVICKVSEHSD